MFVIKSSFPLSRPISTINSIQGSLTLSNSPTSNEYVDNSSLKYIKLKSVALNALSLFISLSKTSITVVFPTLFFPTINVVVVAILNFSEHLYFSYP